MLGFGKINRVHPHLPTGVSPGRAYLLAICGVMIAAVLALVVLVGFSSGRAQADPRPDLYLLPQEALYPEGIAAENKSGTFYVSSVADGSIYRGNVRNEQAEELFLPGGEDGRTQAAGLALDDGLLYVAGGQTGTVFVYDTSSGDFVRSFAAQGTGFLNDVTVNPQSGDAYITDSFVPILWRVPAEDVTGSPQTGELEPWLDLTGTPIAYTAGFNLNGIVATLNGRYLLTIQSNTGNLYRIDTQTKQVTQVDLGGATLTGGDGLVLRGHTLYVVRNQEIITEVSLAGRFTSGRVKGSTSEPSLDFSTTGALVRGRLLVVNSQFDEGGPAGGSDPEIPFTVSSMRAP
jgi:outer membrane protein assembly factor BamB